MGCGRGCERCALRPAGGEFIAVDIVRGEPRRKCAARLAPVAQHGFRPCRADSPIPKASLPKFGRLRPVPASTSSSWCPPGVRPSAAAHCPSAAHPWWRRHRADQVLDRRQADSIARRRYRRNLSNMTRMRSTSSGSGGALWFRASYRGAGAEEPSRRAVCLLRPREAEWQRCAIAIRTFRPEQSGPRLIASVSGGDTGGAPRWGERSRAR